MIRPLFYEGEGMPQFTKTEEFTGEDVDELPWWKRYIGELFKYPRWMAVYIDYTVEIEYTTSPIISARINGPAEWCYPSEGGELLDWSVMLVDATFYDEDYKELGGFELLTNKKFKEIQNSICSDIGDGGWLANEMMDHAANRQDDYFDPF
jgi:hypothetical protein